MTANKLSAIEPGVEREPVKAASDRSFGIVFAVLFAVYGAWPLVSGNAPRIWPLTIAGALALIAALSPHWLAPLNRAWLRFGALLHRVATPIVLGIMYLLGIATTGLIRRAAGKDPLRLRWDKNLPSYWIERKPAGPDPRSMTRQF